jgi:hypothetical protein
MANNSGWFTGVQVQNVSGGPVDVTVSFGANTVGTFSPADEQALGLQSGESETFIQASGQWGLNHYVGPATITADGNIVAIVNEISAAGTGDSFMTYSGFNY